MIFICILNLLKQQWVLAKKAEAHSGLSDLKVRNQLNELDWLHLVKEALPRPSHEEFSVGM